MSRDETARFLATLTGQPDPAVRWQVFDDAKASRVRARHWHATLGEALPDLRAASDAGGGIFVAVNECRGGRKAEHVRRVRALFVDVDPGPGEPKPPEPAWHLPPSMVVETGRGWHAYWLVDDCPLAEFEAAQVRLIAHYGSDPKIRDLARVMRVPGWPHQKGDPLPVTLHSVAEPRLVYHAPQVLAGLADLPEPAAVAPSPPPTTRPAAPASGAAGDWATCDAVGLFRAAGLYRRALGPDKHAVVCPWESEHSSPGGDGDTSTVLWEPAAGKAWPQFRCAHAHCDGREWRDVVAALGPATVAAHCTRPAWGLAAELPELIESCYRDFGPADPRQVAQVGPPPLSGPDRGPPPPPAEEWPKMVKGKPARDWPDNTTHLLRSLGLSIRRNLMTQRIEIGSVTGRVLTYDDLLAEMETAARCRGYKLALRPLENHLRLLANAHSYHPVREWVEAGPAWDGRDRLDDLFGSLALAPGADPDLCRELVRVWLLSAAAMLDAVGTAREVSTQGVLVLVGPQGCGKTRWLKGLAPVGVLEGVSLDPDNRDSVERATHAWIVELGELDATFRADIAKLKAFVTVTTDTYRKAYGHAEATWPRRTAFCGSVNETKFLVDQTGNRRWWTVPVVGCEPYGLDRQQLWQQCLYEVRQPHARWWLDPATEERLRVVNEGHEVPDPFLDAVEEMFEPSEGMWTKQTDIMEKVRQRFNGWGKPQINATAAALRRLGFAQRKIRGTRQWAVVPSPSYVPATRQDWTH